MNQQTTPKLYLQEQLVLGSKDSCIGIVTLWSSVHKITQQLSSFRIAGQLYTNSGISTLLRNCLIDKGIRYLIITGSDLSGSGKSLIALFENGIDNSHSIKGISEKITIDKSIPAYAIETLRNNIAIIDMIHISSTENYICALNAKISSIPFKPCYGQPELLSEENEKNNKNQEQNKPCKNTPFQAETSGHISRSGYIGDIWIDLLENIMKFGSTKQSEYHTQQKELLNTIAIIETEDPDSPQWKEYYQFSEHQLKEYLPKMLSSCRFEGVAYTYGQRLMDFSGIDQIEEMAAHLKKAQFTRRAISVTWDTKSDTKSANPPCLILIQGIIQDSTLHLTAYFRSNDIFGAWPMNAYAIRALQKKLCLSTGTSLGSLTTISCSAHIYEKDWECAQNIINSHKRNRFSNCQIDNDPRGNFIISLDNKKIIAKHTDKSGSTIKTYSSETASGIIAQIQNEKSVSAISHAFYLGKELQKAEHAQLHNKVYIQE